MRCCGGTGAPPSGPLGAPGDGFFLLHNADFVGHDDRTTTEGCASLEEAARLIQHGHPTWTQPRRHDVAYAWRDGEALVTIPVFATKDMSDEEVNTNVVNGAKWSTGSELIVYAKDTGHRSRGKILIALEVSQLVSIPDLWIVPSLLPSSLPALCSPSGRRIETALRRTSTAALVTARSSTASTATMRRCRWSSARTTRT